MHLSKLFSFTKPLLSHKGRRISEDAFDEVLHILHDVLVAHKMEEADIQAVAELVISHKKDIVEIQNSVRVHKG